MRLLWSGEAESDRIAIFQASAAESVFAADALDVMIEEGAETLLDAPESGRPANAGTRELIVHPSYRMIYDIAGEDVRILAIVHATRMWPGE